MINELDRYRDFEGHGPLVGTVAATGWYLAVKVENEDGNLEVMLDPVAFFAIVERQGPDQEIIQEAVPVTAVDSLLVPPSWGNKDERLDCIHESQIPDYERHRIRQFAPEGLL